MLTKEILRIKGTVLYTIAPEGRLWDAVGSMVEKRRSNEPAIRRGSMPTCRLTSVPNPD